MALFRRQKAEAPESIDAGVPAWTDWSNIAAVQGEWGDQSLDRDENLAGWREGFRLSQEGVGADQVVQAAELLTRGLRNSLFGADLLPATELAATVQQVLGLLEGAPRVGGFDSEYRFKLVRLALTVAKTHRWQPPELGGDGSVAARFDSPMVVGALRYDQVPLSATVTHFFSN